MSLMYRTVKQHVGKTVNSWSTQTLGRAFTTLFPVLPNVSVDAIGKAQRVLIVRPNFRIGNILMSTPLIIALRERFPGAQLDYLCGDTTAALLAHLPVDTVHVVSRRFVAQPWQFIALFVRLRRTHYDVAVDAGMNSFSGGLYAYLTGARYRIGCGGKAARFFNVRLPPVRMAHAYGSAPELARLFGVRCPDRPVYVVSAEEQAAARLILNRLQFVTGTTVLPFIGLFVGGHLGKRWPTAHWNELVHSLANCGAGVVVFLGPEERPLERKYRRELPPSVRVLPPQSMRLFAALWGAARLVVATDSGPAHLAAALGVPVITIMQSDASRAYAPRGELDRTLVRPTVAEALATVTAHPAYRDTLELPPTMLTATSQEDAAHG